MYSAELTERPQACQFTGGGARIFWINYLLLISVRLLITWFPLRGMRNSRRNEISFFLKFQLWKLPNIGSTLTSCFVLSDSKNVEGVLMVFGSQKSLTGGGGRRLKPESSPRKCASGCFGVGGMDPDYTHPPPFCTKLYALSCYWTIDWMIGVRCLQPFPLFSEKPFYSWSLIFFHTEN